MDDFDQDAAVVGAFGGAAAFGGGGATMITKAEPDDGAGNATVIMAPGGDTSILSVG